MSYNTVPDQQVFITRIAERIRANTDIFPSSGTKLLTKILVNAPAVDTSPEAALPPYAYVEKSRTPPRLIKNVGRDNNGARGGALWEYEFYVITVMQSLSRGVVNQELTKVAALMRQSLESDLQLKNGGNTSLCRRLTTYEIPYLIGLEKPDFQAINVVIKLEVYVEIR